mmetsp:Transcript_40597/g.67854  ORF Transcript_40597/g.67854 Transcript_40597/m.67854 type:complete len:81 (+) Transcript_40597:30-272(+)
MNRHMINEQTQGVDRSPQTLKRRSFPSGIATHCMHAASKSCTPETKTFQEHTQIMHQNRNGLKNPINAHCFNTNRNSAFI